MTRFAVKYGLTVRRSENDSGTCILIRSSTPQGDTGDLTNDMRNYNRRAAKHGLPGPPVSSACFI